MSSPLDPLNLLFLLIISLKAFRRCISCPEAQEKLHSHIWWRLLRHSKEPILTTVLLLLWIVSSWFLPSFTPLSWSCCSLSRKGGLLLRPCTLQKILDLLNQFQKSLLEAAFVSFPEALSTSQAVPRTSAPYTVAPPTPRLYRP